MTTISPTKSRSKVKERQHLLGPNLLIIKKYFFDNFFQLIIVSLYSFWYFINSLFVFISSLYDLVLIRIYLFDFPFYSLNSINNNVQHIIHFFILSGVFFHSFLLLNIRINQLIFTSLSFLMDVKVLLLDIR